MLTDFRLKIFYTVALKKNFTKAAKDLNISQPAVSQNIAELEQQVGDSLFDRGKEGVSLTRKGEILLDYTTRILHLYDCLNRELVPDVSAPATVLRIAACPIAAKFLIPQIAEKFKTVYKSVEIILLERESYEIESMVADGISDLGIIDGLPEKLMSEPFADFSVSGDGRKIKSLNFVFRRDTSDKKIIDTFILTSKTCL